MMTTCHRTNFWGYVPFHSMVEWKIRFSSVDGVVRFTTEEKCFELIDVAHFVATTKEKSICLRREANPDRWIGRRTLSHCTSRLRHLSSLSLLYFALTCLLSLFLCKKFILF